MLSGRLKRGGARWRICSTHEGNGKYVRSHRWGNARRIDKLEGLEAVGKRVLTFTTVKWYGLD